MTVAALNCQMLALTSYKADIEFKLQRIMDQRQYLAYKTIGISNAKAKAMQEENDAAQTALQQQECVIQAYDKICEMYQGNLETQQKAAATELESVQKLLETNVKREFKINA